MFCTPEWWTAMEIIKAVRVGVLGLKVRSQQIFGMAVSFSQKYDSDDDHDENDNAGEDEADERKILSQALQFLVPSK